MTIIYGFPVRGGAHQRDRSPYVEIKGLTTTITQEISAPPTAPEPEHTNAVGV